ncbi:MAG: DUF1553 domain-containing protein, partial [Planctomycetes bacterium]|nr:DUF1553 domain-containing protein [Planctomycetota bacterium]
MTRFSNIVRLSCLALAFALGGAVGLEKALTADKKPPAGSADKTARKPNVKRSVDFEKQIQPLLLTHCVKCHGPKKQKGGLRLDHRETALRGGDGGRLFVPGKSADSEIVERITSKDNDTRMPPPDQANKPLSAAQIALIRKWIDEGGQWPKAQRRLIVHSKHWAYQPIGKHAPPRIFGTELKKWIRNAIDQFVAARLHEKKLTPSPTADRYTLIKRLHYDLIGLPPTLKDVDAFVNDASPDAYEKLVDRLLRSKHFGERWGRHWLDKARYADSDGYEKDRPRLNAWRYRDWVISAINADMPFDQFTREQLAGDLLPNATPMQKLATAFHRQTLTNTEGGTDKEQFRVEAVFDRSITTGTVWLGQTFLCAQCHSHKYDPFTQAEFYQLFAFYNNGDETNLSVNRSPEIVAKYKRDKIVYDAKFKKRDAELSARRKKLSPGFAKWAQTLQHKLQSALKNKIRFHPVKIRKMHAVSGAKLTTQKDGSILVSGMTPETDIYYIDLQIPVAGVRGFRLEVLPHKSLPNRGPGRAPNGNFVLTELESEWHINRQASGEAAPIPFQKATASYSQKKFSPNGALERNVKTGWAIGPQMGKNHHATFSLKQPLDPRKYTFIRLILSQQYGGRHLLGRFRITAVTGTEPGLPLPKEVRAALKLDPKIRSAKQQALLLQHFAMKDAAYRKLNGQIAALKKTAPKQPVMTVRVISQRAKNPRKTRIFRRGDFLQPLAEVRPDTPAVLPPLKPRKKTGMPDRLDFANWLMDPANPLTPRVTVNQVWSHLFGRAIVPTINDFGTRGEKPSHPKLLDWLAKEYIRLKWRRKALIKLIVMSATYRQSSRHRPQQVRIDPQNQLLSRQNRFRVEAETIRDIFLAAGGLLSKKIGGPSVFPPMPADVAALSYAGNFRWSTSKGADRYRRGMYTFFKRTSPHPNLMTFDCPDSNTTNVQRRMSNTPLMALATLNNIVFVESAQAMVKRVLTEAGLKTDAQKIRRIFRRCVARPPTTAETAGFQRLLKLS